MSAQTEKQPTIPEGYLVNAAGHLVPEGQVREQDKLRDQVVTELVAQGERLNEDLKAFKQKALSDIADLINISSQKWQMSLGGKKGNVSLTSFDGELMIQRVYANRITYTEQLEVAKAKVLECVQSWSAGSNQHLATLAMQAFQTNNNGEISVSKLVQMLNYEIEDEDWKVAMEAVRDSLTNNGKAVYVRIYRRDENGKYRSLPLNIAAL